MSDTASYIEAFKELKDSDECTDAGLIAVAGGCAKLQALARWIGRWMDR